MVVRLKCESDFDSIEAHEQAMELSANVLLLVTSSTTSVCVGEVLSGLRRRFKVKDVSRIEWVLTPQQDVVRCHITNHFAFLDDL